MGNGGYTCHHFSKGGNFCSWYFSYLVLEHIKIRDVYVKHYAPNYMLESSVTDKTSLKC